MNAMVLSVEYKPQKTTLPIVVEPVTNKLLTACN